ncbi:MAG TPA: T9SS type A sorting domain-containing protein [Chitinophagaceae bacterium]|nr:T9SS type A sorting domain-containing protein [Chitinophagaceae bacterium]
MDIDQERQFKFSVVPNPASTSVSVSVNADKETEAQVMITDITGRVVLTKTQPVSAGANKVECDTRNFTEGLYNVQVIMDGIKATERLVIKQ